MEKSIYDDIATRTGGNIYIGVVGPVRTGKSTFIKSFMENMVLPNIDDIFLKERSKDELPQSGSGKTVMTAEPKFVPEEAVKIKIGDKSSCSVRLIDCVGYMIDGAKGQLDGDSPRMVTTPWLDYEVSLSEAAEIGTKKVICEHSTIGILVTTDGTVGEFDRKEYVKAEEKIVNELKEINKPFCIILNTADRHAPSAMKLRSELEDKFGVPCIAVNCLTMKNDEIEEILNTVLYQFPVNEFRFSLPEWLMYLPDENVLRRNIYKKIYDACRKIVKMNDAAPELSTLLESDNIERAEVREMDLGTGSLYSQIVLPGNLFYDTLSEYSGLEVRDEGMLIKEMCRMAKINEEYKRFSSALEKVRETGYGIVMPQPEELHFEEPEIVKQGGRFGVCLKASAPSIHLIKADIETEINPVVGSEKQSEDLVKYLLSEFEDSPEKIWETNIFGKSLSELVNEGLNNKLYKMPEEARDKLRITLERVINEGSGGLICIIL